MAYSTSTTSTMYRPDQYTHAIRSYPAHDPHYNETTHRFQPSKRGSLRSRSLSPNAPTAPRSCGISFGNSTTCYASKSAKELSPSRHHISSSSRPPLPISSCSTPTPSKGYVSPFISTKSRPSLYQRATAEQSSRSGGGSGNSGRGRSTSAGGNGGAESPLDTLSASPSMTNFSAYHSSSSASSTPQFPPTHMFVSSHHHHHHHQHHPSNGGSSSHSYERWGSSKDIDESPEQTRCSSRASSLASMSGGGGTVYGSMSNGGGNGQGKKTGLMGKLKKFVSGETGEMTVLYLTPEEARARAMRIKRQFAGRAVVAAGGLGMM